MTIKDLIKNFTDTAKEKGITLGYSNEYGVDSDIFTWIPNAEVITNPVPTGSWKMCDENGTRESEMLTTAVKMSLSQAIQYFTKELIAGTFDKKETYRLIFITETDVNGNSLKLWCNRRSDGKLSLCVRQVDPGNGWRDGGRAWLAGNEPSFPEKCSAPEPLKTCSLDIAKVEKLALAIIEKYAGGRANAFIELRDEIMKL